VRHSRRREPRAPRGRRGVGEELGVLGAPITSLQNAVVKRAASLRLRKFREREGAFLVEGADLVAAGIAAGRRPQVVFVRRGSAAEAAVAGGTAHAGETAGGMGGAAARGAGPAPLPAALAGLAVYPLSDRVAAKVSTLETPPDVMAVFALPSPPPLEALRGAAQRRGPATGGGTLRQSGAPAGHSAAAAKQSAAAEQSVAPLVVYADGVADPGNMGTLLRAAAAFGAAALVAAPGSVDLYGPKTVRAGMGAVFALPLYQDVRLADLVSRLGVKRVYGLVAHGGAPLADAELRRPAVLCVGAERAGLAPETLACVTDLLTIELATTRPGVSSGWSSSVGGAAGVSAAGAPAVAVESLNAGVAGAIALYEFARREGAAARGAAAPPGAPSNRAGSRPGKG